MKRIFKNVLFILMLAFSFIIIGCEEIKSDETILDEAFIKIVEDINITEITENIILPTSYEDITIVWESGNTDVISNEGVVNRQETDVIVKLNASLSINDITKEYEISVKVIALEKVVTYAVLLPQTENGNVEVSKLADITLGEIITVRVYCTT